MRGDTNLKMRKYLVKGSPFFEGFIEGEDYTFFIPIEAHDLELAVKKYMKEMYDDPCSIIISQHAEDLEHPSNYHYFTVSYLYEHDLCPKYMMLKIPK